MKLYAHSPTMYFGLKVLPPNHKRRGEVGIFFRVEFENIKAIVILASDDIELWQKELTRSTPG